MTNQAKKKPARNRYANLVVEDAEPDESVASNATGVTSRIHHTRGSPAVEAPARERIEAALKDAIHIIDTIPSSAEWWTLASNRLLDLLRPALDAIASLPPTAHGSADTSRVAIPVQDVMPGPTSPDVSIQSSFCPLPLTVHDVEAAVARALPAILQSEIARGLQGLKDTLQTGRDSQTGEALWTRPPACCSDTHQPSLAHKPPPPPNERDVFVSLAKVPPTHATHALSEGEVKALVDATIARTAGSSTPAVHGVKKLANGTLRIRTTSEDVRDALVKEPDGWLPALGDGVQLARDVTW